MKKSSRAVALSAIACAFSTLGLTVGTLYSPLLFTGYLAACLCMMLPLSKGYFKGAALCFVATNVLTLLFNGFNFFDTLPYTLFFGLHPLINEWQARLKKRRTAKRNEAANAARRAENNANDEDEPFADCAAYQAESNHRKSEKKGVAKCSAIDVVFELFKTVWFDCAMFFVWKVVFAANTTIAFVDEHILLVIGVLGSLFFLVYDCILFRLRTSVNALIDKYVGKK